MAPYEIPSNWPDYCRKSKAWCDGFHEAVDKANKRQPSQQLKDILNKINGITGSGAVSPGGGGNGPHHGKPNVINENIVVAKQPSGMNHYINMLIVDHFWFLQFQVLSITHHLVTQVTPGSGWCF